MNSENGYNCAFMAAAMKNYNAKCYNLSQILFIFCSFYVLTAQVSGLLNKTKASLKRDSTFNTNFDGDTLMSGMSLGSVTETGPTRSKYLLPTFCRVCGLPFIRTDPTEAGAPSTAMQMICTAFGLLCCPC